MKKHLLALIPSLLLFALVMNSCGVFSGAGRDLGSGLVHGIGDESKTLDSVVNNIATTLVNGITDKEGERKLRAFIDSLIFTAGHGLNAQTVAIRDSLLPYIDSWVKQVKNDLIGASTTSQLAAIREEVLGARTKELVDQILKTVSVQLNTEVASLKEELIGPTTSNALAAIVAKLIDTLNHGLNTKLYPGLKDQEEGVQKIATGLLWTIGAIILVLMVAGTWLYLQRKKYMQVSELLTNEIHNIPDQSLFDELTYRVSTEAKKRKLEPALKKILEEQGITGRTTWKVGNPVLLGADTAHGAPNYSFRETSEVKDQPKEPA